VDPEESDIYITLRDYLGLAIEYTYSAAHSSAAFTMMKWLLLPMGQLVWKTPERNVVNLGGFVKHQACSSP